MSQARLPGPSHGPQRRQGVLLTAGQWWLVAAVLVLLGAFAVITDGAREGDALSSVDPSLHDTIVAHRSTSLTPFAQAFTFLGNLTTMLPLTLLVVVVLWRMRDRWLAAVFAAGMAGSAAMTYVGKLLVARHRPSAQWMMNGFDTEFAFPSGHTLNVTVFFGLLAAMLWVGGHHRSWRWIALVAALVVPIGVAASRLYLGYHWFTDVVGAWVLGVAWVGLLTFVLVEERRRRDPADAPVTAR